MLKSKTRARIAAVALSALFLSACSDGGSEQSADKLQSLKVTIDGTTTSAAILLGEEQGFFEDEGLDLEITTNGNPPAAAAALQSNEVDIASMPVIPGLNAQGQGLNVVSIASVAGYPDDVEEGSSFDTYGAYAREGSGITDASDLAGARVAVNARKTIWEAFVIDAAQKNGVDPADIEFIPLDFSSQVESMRSERIDVAVLPLPFTLELENMGLESLWSPGVDFYEGGSTSTWMASPDVIADEELVARFQRAIARSNAYANENIDEAMVAAAEESGISVEVLEEGGRFQYFPESLDIEYLELVNQKLADIGFMDEPVNLDGMYIEQVATD